MAKIYKPIKSNQELDFELALSQAAQCLDICATYANESRNVQELLLVTDGWFNLARGLRIEEYDEGEPPHEEGYPNPIGFVGGGVGEIVEPEETYDDGSTEEEYEIEPDDTVRVIRVKRHRRSTVRNGRVAGQRRKAGKE